MPFISVALAGVLYSSWLGRVAGVGAPASDIAVQYERLFKEKGHEAAFTYGPCTGLGLVETEAPWIEADSTYLIQPNMTFQIDTFGVGSNFGVRWEKPVVVRETGVELLSPQIGEIIELDV